jgi:thioredoxin
MAPERKNEDVNDNGAKHAVELTRDNFEQVVGGDGVVLVDVRASWCGPRRMFAPVCEKAAARNPDLVLGGADAQAQPQLAAPFQISSVPTPMIVRDGVVLYAQPAALPEAALGELIGTAREVDMDQVRREPAARTEAAARP